MKSEKITGIRSEKITGIRSVDFKIISKGHGVVNWNGATTLKVQDDSKLGKNNHTLPKLRGYTNFSGKITEKGFKEYKEPTDIDFDVVTGTPLYISQNCIRHHLFREQAFDVHYVNKHSKEIDKLLASIVGLVRGYVVTAKIPLKRTSCLLLEDFVDQEGNGNYEQFSVAGKMDEKLEKRDKNSFYSKTTFGKTKYFSYGSISIEQLQFISLDNKFDRAAMIVDEKKGKEVAKLIEEYIQSLDTSRSPKAIFHENYVRNGTIFKEGEAGIFLNDDATAIVIDEVLRKLSELSIRQSKSYMYVDEITVDYNDSTKMMRVKEENANINSTPQSEYAQYFYAKDK